MIACWPVVVYNLRRPFVVEQEYFVQLFLEFDERVEIPTVGSLMIKMFLEQDISFTEVHVYHLTAHMCMGVHNIVPCPHLM